VLPRIHKILVNTNIVYKNKMFACLWPITHCCFCKSTKHYYVLFKHTI